MTTQVASVLIIIVIMSIAFLLEKIPLAFTSFLVPVALQATGILTASEAWAGFSNTSIISYIGLFILGAVFAKSSFVFRIKKVIIRNSQGSVVRVLGLCMLMTWVIGMLTSASAGIAVATPILLEISKEAGVDKKRVLKPCADVVIFGGVQVLPLGSSLTYFLMMNAWLENAGTDLRFGLMDFTIIKFPLFFLLFAYWMFASRKLKANIPSSADQSATAIDENERGTVYTPMQDKLAISLFFINLVLMVIASYTNFLPVYLISSIFAVLATAVKLLSEKEAFQSISWSTLFLVAGTLPLSTAITKSGTGEWLTAVIRDTFPSASNPIVLVAVFMIFSCIVTHFMSNTAVWAAFIPLAATMSLGLGVDPRLTVAGVAIGAIICFMTPMATPAEAYVYGVGEFTMKEFVKAGFLPCLLMVVGFLVWAPIAMNFLY